LEPERLYESLGELHNFDTLEELLAFSARVIADGAVWSTVLVTFYLDEQVYFGASGCPEGTREQFQKSYERSTIESRNRKRQALMEHAQPGTNVCFIPAGSAPQPSPAFIKSPPSNGSWDPEDRLVVFMRNCRSEIIGVLSLDNPRSGDRPDDAEFQRLAVMDRFINVVGKIAENRFLSHRLAESEQAYRSIFDSVTDGLIIMELDGTLVAANPAIAEMHGRSVPELIGESVKILVCPESFRQLGSVLEAARTETPVDLEARSIRADGTSFDVEVRGRAFSYQGKRRFLAAVRDVSERNRMMFKLLESQKEESVVAMAGGIAHDFNNALMGITGSLGLLDLDSSPESPYVEHCNRIRESAKRLRGLTAQLLSVAQGTRSEPRSLDLVELVDESLGAIHGMAGQRITVCSEGGAGLHFVEADGVQLRQVLLDLALNACDAMPTGGALLVRVSTEDRTEAWTCSRTGMHPPGRYTVLRIQDDGEGMDEATIRRIFEPYYSTRGANRGLGMPAVLGIVKRHRGSIAVTSVPGAGTIVEVCLRACKRAPLPEAPDLEHTPPQGGTVLVVDDEPMVREVAEEMVRELGWNTLTADCGTTALELFDAHRDAIDLVLLDQQMPGMSGTEVSRALWRRDRKVRILLSSGHSEELVREDMDSGGCIVGFLQKPYTLTELSVALHLAFAGA